MVRGTGPSADRLLAPSARSHRDRHRDVPRRRPRRPTGPGLLTRLVHVIADYGPGDLAFAELVQRLGLVLPGLDLQHTRVAPGDTLAAGYCVARLALTHGTAGRLVLHDVAGPDRELERLCVGRTPDGVLVAGRDAGWCWSFVVDALRGIWVLDVPARPWSRDPANAVPKAVVRVLAGHGHACVTGCPARPFPRTRPASWRTSTATGISRRRSPAFRRRPVHASSSVSASSRRRRSSPTRTFGFHVAAPSRRAARVRYPPFRRPESSRTTATRPSSSSSVDTVTTTGNRAPFASCKHALELLRAALERSREQRLDRCALLLGPERERRLRSLHLLPREPRQLREPRARSCDAIS